MDQEAVDEDQLQRMFISIFCVPSYATPMMLYDSHKFPAFFAKNDRIVSKLSENDRLKGISLAKTLIHRRGGDFFLDFFSFFIHRNDPTRDQRVSPGWRYTLS